MQAVHPSRRSKLTRFTVGIRLTAGPHSLHTPGTPGRGGHTRPTVPRKLPAMREVQGSALRDGGLISGENRCQEPASCCFCPAQGWPEALTLTAGAGASQRNPSVPAGPPSAPGGGGSEGEAWPLQVCLPGLPGLGTQAKGAVGGTGGSGWAAGSSEFTGGKNWEATSGGALLLAPGPHRPQRP